MIAYDILGRPPKPQGPARMEYYRKKDGLPWELRVYDARTRKGQRRRLYWQAAWDSLHERWVRDVAIWEINECTGAKVEVGYRRLYAKPNKPFVQEDIRLTYETAPYK